MPDRPARIYSTCCTEALILPRLGSTSENNKLASEPPRPERRPACPSLRSPALLPAVLQNQQRNENNTFLSRPVLLLSLLANLSQPAALWIRSDPEPRGGDASVSQRCTREHTVPETRRARSTDTDASLSRCLKRGPKVQRASIKTVRRYHLRSPST